MESSASTTAYACTAANATAAVHSSPALLMKLCSVERIDRIVTNIIVWHVDGVSEMRVVAHDIVVAIHVSVAFDVRVAIYITIHIHITIHIPVDIDISVD